MTSELKRRANNNYYCSNCMMMQPTPPSPNCMFCGNWFSNYENVVIETFKETTEANRSEQEEIVNNESHFRRRD